MGDHVGRESAMGLGKGALQGQCSPNEDVGNWYSIPAAGECAPGDSIGTKGCTWGPAKRLRTIAASCLVDRGLLDSCQTEVGHAPFLRSEGIFENCQARMSRRLAG